MSMFHKFFKKLGFILLPILAWQVLELFILPMDFFTFRAWEALTTGNMFLPGPFYPNQDLVKWSAGDHAPRGPRKKLIRFKTDQYGQRNTRPFNPAIQYDMVIIGDSMIAGSHQDQKDIISEVLQDRYDLNVYNFGSGLPGNVLTYLHNPRFDLGPPKLLVWEMRRDDLFTFVLEQLEPYLDCKMKNPGLIYTRYSMLCYEGSTPSDFWPVLYSKIPQPLLVLFDRFEKQIFYNFLINRMDMVQTPVHSNIKPIWMIKTDEEKMELAYRVIRRVAHYAELDQSKFLFLLLPSTLRQFDPLIKRLEKDGIDTIGFLPTHEYPHGVDIKTWFFEDDSHWREASTSYTADLIYKKYEAIFSRKNPHFHKIVNDIKKMRKTSSTIERSPSET